MSPISIGRVGIALATFATFSSACDQVCYVQAFPCKGNATDPPSLPIPTIAIFPIYENINDGRRSKESRRAKTIFEQEYLVRDGVDVLESCFGGNFSALGLS